MESLRKTNRVLRTLSECSHTLIRAKDELELMKDICRIVVDFGGYRLAWVSFAEDNREKILLPVAHWGYEEGYLEGLNLTWADTERGRGPTGREIRNGAPSVFQNILTNPDFEFWREEALKRGYASAVAMPLKGEDKPFGVLSICAAEPDAFDQDELRLLEELANDLAFSIMTLRMRNEREQLRKALLQAQKMEAIGTLAGGIAHDFNNILGAIITCSEIALDEIPDDHPVHDDLDHILKAGLRGKALVKQILSFSRTGEQERQAVRLHSLVKECLKLLRASLPSTIDLRQHLPVDTGSVLVDPTQIHQVIMNLCTNAAQAIGEQVGELAVNLAPVALDAETVADSPSLPGGSYLKLTVKDSGHGMTADVQDRIFEPFYTTRKKSGGTGLGLAVVYGIVKRNGGAITVDSTPGSGTAFHVFLPRIEPLDVIAGALQQIQAASGAPEVIISTGYGDADGAELAIKSGAWDYIEKSSSAKAIRLSLSRALQYREEKKTATLAEAVKALRRKNIIGDSPQIRSCLDMVAQATLSDINVLISGETGTGKELFAQAIHNNSTRSQNSFVVVDCAALPDTLVESLLFGHVKGSFTGADKDRDGLIRQADGGTLFLDEVGELPLSLQKAFLRVLQEHRFRPVGSKNEVKSDFRLVAATNRRLETMVTEGSFRSDLLYRISAFALDLPPLKKRPADIKALARFHTDRLCERMGIAPKGFSPDFFDTLTAYAWPGNIRELVNTLDRCLAAGRYEPTLFPKHLPPKIRIQVVQKSLDHPHQPTEENLTETHYKNLPPLQDFRESIYTQAERQYLADLMDLTAGAPPAPAVIQNMESVGINITQTYGLTEVFGPHSVCQWQRQWDELSAAEKATLKARQGVPYIIAEHMDVVNPKTMEPVNRDGETIGEIVMRGNNVMLGYYKDPEATAEAFKGGWFHSGDLAVMHPDNYAQIVDRKKDIIISGGENISTVEVENVLYSHPDVMEVAVVPIPDEKWGEVPKAFVVLKPDRTPNPEAIIAYCKENLARFKAPKVIEFGDLPKTAIGKIQKYKLREKEWQEHPRMGT